jgi:hypothetical protein
MFRNPRLSAVRVLLVLSATVLFFPALAAAQQPPNLFLHKDWRLATSKSFSSQRLALAVLL